MIDMTQETLISPTEVPKSLPPGRNGRPTHVSTVFRWMLRGVRLPSGAVVRLEAIRMGGRWLTSKEALQRFAEAQTQHQDSRPEPPRSPARRQHANQRAAAELDGLGL
jgi:hypothetical protein